VAVPLYPWLEIHISPVKSPPDVRS
jgi:hypothetical protein